MKRAEGKPFVILEDDLITFNSMVSGRYKSEGEWKDLSPELYNYMNTLFRKFLLGKCRYGYKPYAVIDTVAFSRLKECGLFGRLIYSPKRHRVEYIVGQYEPTEMRWLKDLIIKGAI